ncbi:hypothetical protein K502DRAFT_316589 [Neoconidiobolus thromboides FSU 785]|nr:hypothetical protein K502DRAFT_316589 [Neoconidiobolus thromboides FSU 785]
MSFFSFPSLAFDPPAYPSYNSEERDIYRTKSLSLLSTELVFKSSNNTNTHISSTYLEKTILSLKRSTSFSYNPSTYFPFSVDHSLHGSQNLFFNLMSEEGDSKKSSSTSPNNNDLFLFTPFSRSQSAIIEAKKDSDSIKNAKASSFNLALRRPPARFNNNDNNKVASYSPETLNFFSAVRSVPVSRHNSDELDALLKDLDFLDDKEVKNNIQLNSNRESISSEKLPLEDLTSMDKRINKTQAIATMNPALSEGIEELITSQTTTFDRYSDLVKFIYIYKNNTKRLT